MIQKKIIGILLIVVMILSSTLIYQNFIQAPNTALAQGYTSLGLNVTPSGSSFKLGVNESKTFTATATNGSAPFEYAWTVTASANFTLLLNGESRDVTNASSITLSGSELSVCYPTATEEYVSLTVSVTDVDGYTGSIIQPIVVADPYTSPGYKFDASTATADYIIQSDGLGWYRAVNGKTGAIAWSSTDYTTVAQACINAMPSVDFKPTYVYGWTVDGQTVAARQDVEIRSRTGLSTNYPLSVYLHYGTGVSGWNETLQRLDVYANGYARSDFGNFRLTITGQTTSLSYNLHDVNSGVSATAIVTLTPNLSTTPTYFTINWLPTAVTASETADASIFQAAISTDVKLAMTFKEGSGTSTADYSGNSNTGAITGATWAANTIWGGYALQFDKDLGQFIRVTSSTSTNLAAPFSIIAYVNAADSGGGYYGRIVDKISGSTGYGLQTGVDGNILLNIAGSTPTSANGAITYGSYQNIIASYDASNAKFYVNGTEVTPQAAETGTSTTNTADLYIGNRAATDRGFDGTMYALFEIGHELSETERGYFATYKPICYADTGGSIFFATKTTIHDIFIYSMEINDGRTVKDVAKQGTIVFGLGNFTGTGTITIPQGSNIGISGQGSIDRHLSQGRYSGTVLITTAQCALNATLENLYGTHGRPLTTLNLKDLTFLTDNVNPTVGLHLDGVDKGFIENVVVDRLWRSTLGIPATGSIGISAASNFNFQFDLRNINVFNYSTGFSLSKDCTTLTNCQAWYANTAGFRLYLNGTFDATLGTQLYGCAAKHSTGTGFEFYGYLPYVGHSVGYLMSGCWTEDLTGSGLYFDSYTDITVIGWNNGKGSAVNTGDTSGVTFT